MPPRLHDDVSEVNLSYNVAIPMRHRRSATLARVCVCVTLAALVWIPLSAHEIDSTHLQIAIRASGLVVEITNDPDWLWQRLFSPGDAPPSGATRDRDLDDARARVAEALELRLDGQPLRFQSVDYRPPASHDPTVPAEQAEPGLFRLQGRPPSPASTLELRYTLADGQFPVSVALDRGPPRTYWLAPGEDSQRIMLDDLRPASSWEIVVEYLGVGFVHILPRGLDHILFVLGLVLLSQQLRPLVLQISAFTVAHTITLGLTMAGVLSVPSSVVEPLIAASIVYVAVENLLATTVHGTRLALVFLFGLLHGLGFAGVLTGLGLPTSELFPALLAFNLGVEAGQLTVVALALFGLAWVRRSSLYRRRVLVPTSIAIAAVGLFWTIERVLAAL